ncbi:DUF1992 domain-containing protein [Luteococcus sp. Sow4_B9]|uniref:DnaJ family domain-containing protein n=1 Tax=Luteococcus sp. Sow4_B9 TaxID=3438792 RepID=UPI003F956D67
MDENREAHRWQRPVVFESWIDRQIREATERGEFSNLPGEGKPLRGLGRPDDPNWWAMQKLEQEDLRGAMPGPLAVRREKQDIQQTLADVRDEATARAIVEDLNERIKQSCLTPIEGRTILTGRLDVEETLALWRARRRR